MRQAHKLWNVQKSHDSLKKIEAEFGRWLRDMREERQLTQAQLASAVHLDASAISRIEKGERSIRLAEAVALARAVDVEILPQSLRSRIEPPEIEQFAAELLRMKDLAADLGAQARIKQMQWEEAQAAVEAYAESMTSLRQQLRSARDAATLEGRGVVAASIDLALRELGDQVEDA